MEETYAGLVGDNVKYNRNALAKVSSMFNWLFCIGCVTHCLDLLCEDLSKIPEISEHIGLGKSVVKSVKGHKYVLVMFKSLVNAANGAMLVLYPETRFAYVALMLKRLLLNKQRLKSLSDEEGWKEATTKKYTHS